MDIPSLFMIPSAVSSGKVHSVFPNSTDADFDFNRDSDATRVNSEGLIERVGYYGSELVTNGNFDTDSNWAKGTGWTISGGKAKANTTGSFINLTQSNVFVSGKTYEVKFSITDYTQGEVRLTQAGIDISGSKNSIGTYTKTFTSANSDGRLIMQGLNSFIGSIDNVSVKEITGDRARLNYEIEGGLVNTKPSLLLEPQSTNLITYSEDFSNSAWSKSNGGVGIAPIVTTNYVVSPNGLQDAQKVVFNLNGGGQGDEGVWSLLTQNYSSSFGNTYSLSCYLKGEIGGEQIVFDFDSQNSNIVTLTDEWVRYTFTKTVSTNGSRAIRFGSRGNNGGGIYGSDNPTVYMWGAQFEQLSYATSYIPTNGSTQTRAAETCNGAGTSSIFESSEGILYVETKTPDSSAVPVISLSDGTFSNEVEFAYYGTNQWNFVVRAGGSSNFVSGTTSENTFSKFAISYTSSSYKVYKDGVLIGSQTMASALSGLSVLDFSYPDNTNHFKGNVRDIRVYNTKEMTDSEVDILLTKITS
jgi:hypothetical protein